MKQHQKKTKFIGGKSFSIIELSIVLLIISIISTTSVSLFSSKNEVENIKSTKEKMTVIYQALKNFVVANKRMPCPADPTLKTTDSDFGFEAKEDNSDDCDFSLGDSEQTPPNESDTTIFQGAIPIYALGLSDDMIKDNFGYKFSYIMISGHEKDFDYSNIGKSISDITDSFEYSKNENSENSLNLTYGSNGHIEYPALIIISHGKNGYGAYDYNGNVNLNTPSVNNNETKNYAYDINSGTQQIKIDSDFYYNGSGIFDDIVFYKNKDNLIMDIGWEEKLCTTPLCIDDNENLISCDDLSGSKYQLDNIVKPGITAEFKYHDHTDPNNITTRSCDDDGNNLSFSYQATCGKYGIWQRNAIKKNCSTNLGGYLIAMWSGDDNNIPEGWKICNGNNNTPDLRNRFIVGAGKNASENATSYKAKDGGLQVFNSGDDCDECSYRVGENGGEDKHKLTTNEMPSHKHDLTMTYHSATGDGYGGGKVQLTDRTESSSPNPSEIIMDNTGNGLAHENRPPYYALYYICKKL